MLELELQQYLHREYPQENTYCEWKEFKNLKNSFCGDEKDDVISYVYKVQTQHHTLPSASGELPPEKSNYTSCAVRMTRYVKSKPTGRHATIRG